MMLMRFFLFISLIGFTVACSTAEVENDPAPQEDPEPTQTDTPETMATATVQATATISPTATDSPNPTAVPTETAQSSATLSPLDQALANIQQEVANQLGIDPSTVTIDSVTSKEWRDSSLGCPQEGMMYMQVITSGYQIIVSADGQTFDYRANTRGRFTLCQNSK